MVYICLSLILERSPFSSENCIEFVAIFRLSSCPLVHMPVSFLSIFLLVSCLFCSLSCRSSTDIQKAFNLPDSFLVSWKMNYEQFTSVRINRPIRSVALTTPVNFKPGEKERSQEGRCSELQTLELSFTNEKNWTQSNVSIKEDCIDSQTFRAVRLQAWWNTEV